MSVCVCEYLCVCVSSEDYACIYMLFNSIGHIILLKVLEQRVFSLFTKQTYISLNLSDTLFNFSNNIYMSWSLSLYVAQFFEQCIICSSCTIF